MMLFIGLSSLAFGQSFTSLCAAVHHPTYSNDDFRSVSTFKSKVGPAITLSAEEINNRHISLGINLTVLSRYLEGSRILYHPINIIYTTRSYTIYSLQLNPYINYAPWRNKYFQLFFGPSVSTALNSNKKGQTSGQHFGQNGLHIYNYNVSGNAADELAIIEFAVSTGLSSYIRLKEHIYLHLIGGY